MTAVDPRIAAANLAMGDRIARTHRGHLVAQTALHRIREGEPADVIERARQSLGDDAVALAAFARSVAREVA